MNIVIANNTPRFPGLHRWDFELVRYEDFICHKTNTVAYLVNRRGLSGITAPPGTYELYQLDDLSDIGAHRPLFRDIVREHGKIDRLIAFSESLQDVMSELRAEFGIPGNRPEQNRLGRDKILMKQKVSAHGLRVPRYMPVTTSDMEAAVDFGTEVGYPLILKPTDGHSSTGVKKIGTQAQLRAEIDAMPAGVTRDLEEFIVGELFHIDGLIDRNGHVALVIPSRYVNNCLEFTFGAPLGAVMIDHDSTLHSEICRFSVQCIEAIGLRGCPFHLELFRKACGELVFLEVGARVGGADVPYMIHKATGINLFGEWLNMSMGRDICIQENPRTVGGWLMFPRPPGLPLRVTSVTGFEGKLPSLYRQLVPQRDELIQHEEGYCSMQSGRFLFCSSRAEQVLLDMKRVMSEFSIKTVSPDMPYPESGF